MHIGKHLAMAVIGLRLLSPATPTLTPDIGIVPSIVKAPVTPDAPNTIYPQTGPGEPTLLRYDFRLGHRNSMPITGVGTANGSLVQAGRAAGQVSVQAPADSTEQEISSTGPSVVSQRQRLPPSAPASVYGMDVPLAYYDLSFTLSKRTGGITPPVQGRIFAYMGLALYESVVGGMPHNRSIASSLQGIGPLPRNHGTKYWPLVASAAMAEVMRGLWGDATNVAAQNLADIDSLEQQIAHNFDLQVPLAGRSIDYGHAVGAAVYQTSRDDGEDRSYLTNFPTDYVPPVCDGCWVPTAPGQLALQPFWKNEMTTFVLAPGDCGEDGPPGFSTDPASDAYQEAYEVYVTRNNLTPEQAIIAKFWADGPGTINGPGHSLSTTSQILQLVGANLAQAAETYARVGLAVGDGVYAVWWSKYT